MALFSGGSALAAPWHPTDDGQVLEHLPSGSPRAAGTARRAPGDPVAAAALARSYIEQSRREGDPRFLGYAEGVLKPWWTEPAPPADVRLLRATLLQARHRFDDALRDLDGVIALQPRNAQAWLTRATVLRVQGKSVEAAEACEKLDGVASDFVTDLCAASARSLGSELQAMSGVLEQLVPASHGQPRDVQLWYLAERAGMLERLGRDADALKIYRLALAGGDADPLLRAAAADLLLRLKQPAQALAVAPATSTADVLRLRAAIALRALGTPDAALEASLADAYAAAHRRGEDVHLREEARFTLDVLGDAPRALALAQQNWLVQREPADARVLADAELAAGKP